MEKMDIAFESKIGIFLLRIAVALSIVVSIIMIGPVASASVDACKDATRTIRYDVSAIDIPIPINGWGDVNPQGMIYALNNPEAVPNVAQLEDPSFMLYNTTDQSLPHKIQPLVLRANVGDCIEINLKNELDIAFDDIDPGTGQPIGEHNNQRNVGMQIMGLPYDPETSDGAFIGKNPDTTVAPGQTKVYKWYANRTGGFMFRDTSNTQFPQDTIVKGLFGMVIVEPEGSTWRDSVTGRNFLKSNPQNSYDYSDLVVGSDGKYLGVGASIFADIHQQPGAPLPKGALLWENVSGNDYRDYAIIMHDEFEGVIGPVAWYENGTIAAFGKPFFPATGLQDETFLMNYRSEPLRNREGAWERHRGEIPVPEMIENGVKVQGGLLKGSESNPFVTYRLPSGDTFTVNASNMTVILPNGRKFGPNDNFCNGGTFKSDNANATNDPDYKFYSCVGEESHLQSWPFGDPAVALPRAYWGDPVIFYAGNADSHDSHTYHQHAHRWFHDPDQADINNLPVPENPLQISNRLDVQGIGAGEVFKLVYEQGAGSQAGTAGDSIFHCHLYPHFAGGIWSAFRVFDKLRLNYDTNPDSINATLLDGTSLLYPDGTQEAVLQPLPAKVALINSGLRALAPRGMPNRTATPPNSTQPGYPNFIAGKFGLKALQPPKFVINLTTGEPTKDRATPTQLEINASYDGLRPGAVLVDPCAGPNGEFGRNRKPDRIYEPFAIQVPFILNGKGGFFNPEQRAYVEKEMVDAVRKDPGKLQPYSFRANVGDCVEVHGTNALQPNDTAPTLGVNDGIFHGITNTPEISNHVHIIRFDQLGSDGTSVNWNYDISQRSGETAAYRWFVDINGRTIFSHDHQFPTSHQQGGLWSAFINEPRNSTYYNPNGTVLGPIMSNATHNLTSKKYLPENVKGVGTAANILSRPVSLDKKKGISGGNLIGFREFVMHYSDFTPAFVADPVALKAAFNTLKTNPNSTAPFNPALRQKPYNPPFDPDDFGADQGTTTLNYQVEPFQVRVNISNATASANQKEPAYVYSSRTHGDPETEVLRAYAGDPVVIRMMDGAHEEHHTFEIHGHRWVHQPSDLDSFHTDNQALNIGEWFNFELIGNGNLTNYSTEPPGKIKLRDGGILTIASFPGDYLMGSTPLSDKWNGMWGLFRVENGEKKDLQVLPGMFKPQKISGLGLIEDQRVDPFDLQKVTPSLTKSNNPCPDGTPVKQFDIVAIQKSTVYNSRYGENDPFALMYVLAEDEQAVLSGTKLPEPLVIRANKGDCVKVNLTNKLPDLTSLAAGKNVTFPDATLSPTSLDPNILQHSGDAQMPAIVPARVPTIGAGGVPTVPEGVLPIGGTQIGMNKPRPQFIPVKWPMSNRISMHPHLLKEVASVGDGATVGFMRDQTIGPGESITYFWYADKELGATLLDDYGDERSHRHHGAFAALIIEPNKSIYLDPKDPKVTTDPMNASRIKSGTSAVIHNTTDSTQFREFVPLFADGLNLRKDNTLIPDSDEPLNPEEVQHQPCSPAGVRCEDVEEQGESGINYRAERLSNRVALNGTPPNEIDFNPDAFKVFSSIVFGDPATPVFEAFVRDPVVVRVLRAADLAKVHSIGVAGHSWRHEPNDPGTNIVDTEGSFGVGKSFNYYLIGGAGGVQQAPGDYLYNTRNHVEPFTLSGGQWGLLRVHPIAGVTPGVAPLNKTADLPQIRP